MMLPGEFLRVHREVPWKLRTREWWDTFSFMVGVCIAIVSPLMITVLFPGEVFDIIALVLIIVVSYLFIRFGDLFDPLVTPLQPPFRKLPGRVLVVIGLILPFITAYLINNFSGIGSYPLIIINAIIGTCIAALFLKIPHSFHGNARAVPSGVLPVITGIVFCATCIAGVRASGAMMPAPCLCPESILSAGVIVSALVAGLNAPSVFQRFSKGGQPPGSAAVVTGRAAMDLLAINGLAQYDQARKGYLPAAALAGWLNRPAADALPVKGNRTIGEARDPKTGKVTGQSTIRVTDLSGASVSLNSNGTIQTERSSFVLSQAGSSSGSTPVASPSSGQVSGTAGAQVSGGIRSPGGIDLRTTQAVIDVTADSVKTTIDHAGRTYGIEEGVAGGGAPGPGAGGPGQGSTRAGALFCRFCGAPVIAGAVHCNKCGKKVQVDETPAGSPARSRAAGTSSSAASPGDIPRQGTGVPSSSSSSGTTPAQGASSSQRTVPGSPGPAGAQGTTGPAPNTQPPTASPPDTTAGLAGGSVADGLRSPGSPDLRTTQTTVDVVGESVKTTVDHAGRTYGRDAPAPGPGSTGIREPGAARPAEAIRGGSAGAGDSVGQGAPGIPGEGVPPVKSPSFCRDCGAKIEPDMKFCNMCGRPVQAPPAGSASSVCSVCRAPLLSGTKFCRKCGNPVMPAPARQVCPQCGHEVLPGSVFCRECGKRVG